MSGPKTFTGETTDAKAMREAFEAIREALRRAPEPLRCVNHESDDPNDCPRCWWNETRRAALRAAGVEP